MRRRLQQYSVAAVNFGKSILGSASEMKGVAGPKKYRGVQLLKCVARAPNDSFCYWKPVPKARALVLFKLFPHSHCVSCGQMLFAEPAMHCGIKLRPAMKCTASPRTFLDQLQHLARPCFPEITLYDVTGIQIYHRALRSSEI